MQKKGRRWIAVAAALLFAAQAISAQAEAHHAFMLQKSVALAETMRQMAAAEGYISTVLGTFVGEQLTELAERIGAADYGKPDAVVVIEWPEDLPETLVKYALLAEGKTGLSLLDEPVIVEELAKKMLGTIPSMFMALQETRWLVLNNVVFASGMDDLPAGLDTNAFVLLMYHEEPMACLATFSPNTRWNFVRYDARFIPSEPNFENLSAEMIRELLSGAFSGARYLDLSGLRIVTYTGEQVTQMLGE